MGVGIADAVTTTLELDRNGYDVLAGVALPAARSAREVRVLLAGVVGEVRRLSDGRRQILAMRLPGDTLVPKPGETLVALTAVRLTENGRLATCLADGSSEYQALRRAWVVADRVEQAMLRDQVVRIGRMSAFERMAHLLLETHERIAQVGLARGNTFHLPLTQELLSDVVGLSVVHLNRTLQTLRRQGLVSSKQGYVTLVDRDALIDVAAYVSRFPKAWRTEAIRTNQQPAMRQLARVG